MRADVILVGLNALLQARKFVALLRQPGGCLELRRNFHVVAYAKVEGEIGQAAMNLPEAPIGMFLNESLGLPRP